MPSLLEALEQKYGESSTESEGSEEEGISVSIFVPRKSQRMAIPSVLVLNDFDISSAGEREALINKCSGVEELDLAKNKLNYWNEVLRILQQMPKLKFVNLSFNELSLPLQDNDFERSFKWEHLRNLVLNSTMVNWESVRKILDFSPSLEELHLSMNEYNDVQLCHDKDCSYGNCKTKENEIEDKCECPKVDYKYLILVLP